MQLNVVDETELQREAAKQVQRQLDKFQSLAELDTPRQPNGFDCGVCTCINMEVLARTGDVLRLDFGSQQEELDKARHLIKEALTTRELPAFGADLQARPTLSFKQQKPSVGLASNFDAVAYLTQTDSGVPFENTKNSKPMTPTMTPTVRTRNQVC